MALTVGNPFKILTFTRATNATRINSSGLVETVVSGVPRLDFDPVTLTQKGLLVEEARTNIMLYSQTPDNTVSGNWVKGANSTRLGVVLAPDGTITAPYYSALGTASNSYISQGYTLSAATTYTVSIWAKLISGSVPTSGNIISAIYDNGTPGIRANVPFSGNLTTQWKRFSVTFTNVNLITNTVYFVADQDNTSSIAVWGAQVEVGGFVSSFIPTTSTTYTRNVDQVSLATTAFPYNQPEGTLIVSFMLSAIATSQKAINLDGGAGARVVDIQQAGNSIANYNGTVNMTTTYTATAGSIIKAASAYKSGDYAFVVGGGTPSTATSATLNTATAMHIGTYADGASYPLNGWIRQITYIPRRLTNTELQAKTA